MPECFDAPLPGDRTAAIYTLGCRVNQYESDAIANAMREKGWYIIPFSSKCSVYIINTCTVTAESDRKSRQIIRRARAVNPDAYVIVCGCYSQVSPESAGEDADFVCGTRNKLDVIEAAEKFISGGREEKFDLPEISALPYEPLSSHHTDRTRAFVKIEDGCDGKCTYCLIRKARGNVVSRPRQLIISEMARLYKLEYPEIVLSGIETSAYGRDTGDSLEELLLQTNSLDCPQRIRLGSIDPAWLTPEVSKKLARVEKLMPHIHLSVQSGSSGVLAAMKRRYNADMLYRNVEACREAIPGIRFSADIIAGFPGETEEDLEKTVEFLKFANLIHAHIFPYSERKGTEAADMPGKLEKKEKARRAAYLDAVQKKINEEDASERIGKPLNVLFETAKGKYVYGHSDEFYYVRASSDKARGGMTSSVVPVSYKDGVFEC